MQIFLGDIPFTEIMEKIIKKCENNIKLSSNDEISLLLMSLVTTCTDKYNILKKVTKILKHEDLFDSTRISMFKKIIEIEIRNFLKPNESDELMKKLGDVKMSLKENEQIGLIIEESNTKYIAEVEERGIKKGREEGREEGIKKGREERDEEIILKLLKIRTPIEISQELDYPIETINKIQQKQIII